MVQFFLSCLRKAAVSVEAIKQIPEEGDKNYFETLVYGTLHPFLNMK
jgi:hypothetical protein